MKLSCRFLEEDNTKCSHPEFDYFLKEGRYPDIEICIACLLAKIYRAVKE